MHAVLVQGLLHHPTGALVACIGCLFFRGLHGVALQALALAAPLTHLLSTPRWSAAESAALRLGVRAPQGMRSMGPLEGVLSPLVEEPPPSREGRSLLALFGGFLDALIVAACSRLYHLTIHPSRQIVSDVCSCHAEGCGMMYARVLLTQTFLRTALI